MRKAELAINEPYLQFLPADGLNKALRQHKLHFLVFRAIEGALRGFPPAPKPASNTEHEAWHEGGYSSSAQHLGLSRCSQAPQSAMLCYRHCSNIPSPASCACEGPACFPVHARNPLVHRKTLTSPPAAPTHPDASPSMCPTVSLPASGGCARKCPGPGSASRPARLGGGASTQHTQLLLHSRGRDVGLGARPAQ